MPMRKNGFERPFNGMQISTYVLLVLLFAHFGICLTIVLPTVISIVATSIFGVVGCLSMYFGYVTTKTDSIDERLYEHLNHTPHPNALRRLREGEGPVPRGVSNDTENPDSFRSDDTAGTKYCWVCQTTVYELSMHCKYCDKCVQKFDHHCMWLNTCIGEANYPTFFKTVVYTFIFILVHFLTIVTYTVFYFMDLEDMKQVSSDWFQTGRPAVLLAINLAFLVFLGFAATLVLQLLYFHICLRKKNMTTYEYILEDSARKRETATLDDRIRQRRSQELNRSNLGVIQKSCIQATGVGICKPCDPVRKNVVKENAQNTVNGNSSPGRSPTSGESNSPERALSVLDSDDSEEEEGSIVNSSNSVKTGCIELTSRETKKNEYEQVPAGSNVSQENHIQ